MGSTVEWELELELELELALALPPRREDRDMMWEFS